MAQNYIQNWCSSWDKIDFGKLSGKTLNHRVAVAPGSNPSPDIYQNFHWYLIIPPLLHQLVPLGSLFRQIWIWLIILYNKVNLWCVFSCLGWKLFLKRREERFFVWVINNLFNIQLMINNLQLFLNQTYCNCIFLKYINHSFSQKV